jgi:hypothetical protein
MERHGLAQGEGVSIDLEIDAVLRAMGNFRSSSNVHHIAACYQHRAFNVRLA